MAKGMGIIATGRGCAGALATLALLSCSSEPQKLRPVVVTGVNIKEQQVRTGNRSFSKEKPALNYLMTSLSSFFINDAQPKEPVVAKQFHQASPASGRLAAEFWRSCLKLKQFREPGPGAGKPNFVLVSVFKQNADPTDDAIRKQVDPSVAVERPQDCYWSLLLFRSGGATAVDLSNHIVPGTPADELPRLQGKPDRVDRDQSKGCLIYYYADSRVVVNAKTKRVVSWSDFSSNLRAPCWLETVRLTINP